VSTRRPVADVDVDNPDSVNSIAEVTRVTAAISISVREGPVAR
jgi:hypothetical protein